MRETQAEMLLQRAKEKSSDPRPCIISGNKSQVAAKYFKESLGISRIVCVRSSPYYSWSNGKLARRNRRPKVNVSGLTFSSASRLVEQFVAVYKERLQNAPRQLTPEDGP